MSHFIRFGLLLTLSLLGMLAIIGSGGGDGGDGGNGDARDEVLIQSVVGTWFTQQNDDGTRQDNTTDTTSDEIDGIEVISKDNTGTWMFVTTEGTFTFPEDRITVNSDNNTITLEDDDGLGRTILTYNEATNSLSGEWQKLADDNVTWYSNYETWSSVEPCKGVGGPTSYDDFTAVINDCAPQMFTANEIAGKSYIFDSANNEEHNFNADGTGIFTNDNGVSEIDFTWSIDSNGHLEILYNPIVPMAKDVFVKYGTDITSGGFLIKAYSEGDNSWPSDSIFDSTADGEIYQETLFLRPAWKYVETIGQNTCNDPEGDIWFESEVIIFESGNDLTLVNFYDNPVNATRDNSGMIQGIPLISFPELGGTTTWTALNLEFTDANTIDGTVGFSWDDGVSPCTGTNTISMTKIQ